MSASGSSGGDVATIAGGTASGAAVGTSVLPGYGTAAGAVLGAGLSIYGAITASQDQDQVDQEKAQLEQSQAQQVQLREEQNDAIRNQATFETKLNVSSGQAGSGHETAGVGSQLEVQRQANEQTMINDQAAAFQESQLYAGAGLESQAGSEAGTAGYISAAGTAVSLLGKGAQPSSGFTNYSGIQSLPAPGSSFSAGPSLGAFNYGSP